MQSSIDPNQWTTLEVYEKYDGPRLFSTKSPTGQLYLVFWTDTYRGQGPVWDEWLYVPMSVGRLLQVRAGALTLREAIEQCEEGFVLRVKTHGDGRTEATLVAVQDLTEEDKPAADARLDVNAAPPAELQPDSHLVVLVRRRPMEDDRLDVFRTAEGVEDPEAALRTAVETFLRGPEGRQAIEDSDWDFNFGDAIAVLGNEDWQRGGLTILPEVQVVEVDQDEVLIPEDLPEDLPEDGA